MAYCLRTLVQTLEQVLHPNQHHKTWLLDHHKIPQIQLLIENATFLRDFLDNSSPLIQDIVQPLEEQIRVAAEKAEDTLESYITSEILSSPEGQAFMVSPPDMGDVIQVLQVLKQEVVKITRANQQSDNNVARPVSTTRYPESNNVVVGVAGDLIQLKNRLTDRVTKLNIIPIVGMGGMGKTNLARILYDEYSSSKSHFDVCAWVTVSQSYHRQLILQTILSCVTGKPLKELSHLEYSDLILDLHKCFTSRRYLVVLDDVWSCEAWDSVQRAFPRENQGSRIILTTRVNTLADYVQSESHEMHLINKDDSWELLRRIVFDKDCCPLELEKAGKRIATNCGGLPLALQVIGGFLSHSQINKEIWEYFADNVRSLITKTDDQFSGIFSWSFSHLPHYLKPCLLYMGVFPEDHDINASKLIQMWVAEGFLLPIENKSQEDAAEIHLNSLVDRNLIFVRERKSNGKVKSYGIHDLLRDLCLRKARDTKFLYVKDSKTDILQEDSICSRRVSVHSSHSKHFQLLKLTSVTRSFLINGVAAHRILSCLCFNLSLMRVLDMLEVEFPKFPDMILRLVNLRYLAVQNRAWFVPESISILRNLQTLIVDYITSIALLLDLPQLTHLKFSYLMRTSEFHCDEFFEEHKNLQRLSDVQPETLELLLGKLPNLKKLCITSDETVDIVLHLTYFQNLETLKCTNAFLLEDGAFISNIIFPNSLQKLTLFDSGVPQTVIDDIAALPNLVILKMISCTFEVQDWEPPEDGFRKLQYLQIASSNLVKWLATEDHFPVLQHLVIRNSRDLIDIPEDIGSIVTLEIIEVDFCEPCVVESAKRIFEEQHSLGNTNLQLRISG